MWSGTEHMLLLAHANGPHKNVKMVCMQKRMRGLPVNRKKVEEGFMRNIKHILDQIANIL
jgi:hypothetical protein